MSCSLSILDSPRSGPRVLPFRGRAPPAELGSLRASGSRNPEGESGNNPIVAIVLPAGSSRALRVLLPGHIQLEKRVRDIAITGKNENNSYDPSKNWVEDPIRYFSAKIGSKEKARSTRTKIAHRTGCLSFL